MGIHIGHRYHDLSACSEVHLHASFQGSCHQLLNHVSSESSPNQLNHQPQPITSIYRIGIYHNIISIHHSIIMNKV